MEVKLWYFTGILIHKGFGSLPGLLPPGVSPPSGADANCGLGQHSPTFTLTHVHQAWLPDLEVEDLVFLIFLIIDYFDLYSFAETENKRIEVAGERERESDKATGKKGGEEDEAKEESRGTRHAARRVNGGGGVVLIDTQT